MIRSIRRISFARRTKTFPFECHQFPNYDHFSRRGVNTKSNIAGSWRKVNPILKSPGGKHNIFKKIINSSAIQRMPPIIFLLMILNDEDYSPIPFKFELMTGPSMLPTIFPMGECYIRLKKWALNQNLHSGDIIVFRDVKGGYACKRIIGLEGESVNRFGQYSHLYRDEGDLGIREIPMKFTWEDDIGVRKVNGKTKVDIPSGMVWVEGDNPLHSVDSRHYGPIQTSCILGKVIYRIWPRERKDLSPCAVKPIRPHPLKESEVYNGLYGMKKVPYSK